MSETEIEILEGLSENIKIAKRGWNISKITKELYDKEVNRKIK